MTGMVYARCGMSALRPQFVAYPAQHCAGYQDFQGLAGDFTAAPILAIQGEAAFETEPYQGAMALADEPSGPVFMDAGPAPDEPLALNLGVTDLLYLLRQDVLSLRAAVDATNPNYDPGDLTAPFNANL